MTIVEPSASVIAVGTVRMAKVVPPITMCVSEMVFDVVGRILVSNWLPERETGSVVPEIVTIDSSGPVDVGGWIVARD